MMYGELKNKSVLTFNQQSEARMYDLCRPLWKVGISKFTVGRCFKDGKRLYLSSSSEWVKHYLANKFQDYSEHLECYMPPADITYCFWDGFTQDKVFDALRTFEFGHGFSIYEHYPDYVDQFDFAAHRDDFLMTKFYLKNLYFLKSFIKDFKIKAFDLINDSIQEKLIIPIRPTTVEYRSFITQDKIENFMNIIKQTEKTVEMRKSPNLLQKLKF